MSDTEMNGKATIQYKDGKMNGMFVYHRSSDVSSIAPYAQDLQGIKRTKSSKVYNSTMNNGNNPEWTQGL